MNDGKFHCGVLIRVGSTEKILGQYENRYLRFGCPANWINYANTHQDGIADEYEGVFAHVKQDDPRLELSVPVPGRQSYARVVPASRCKMIQFDNFSEDLSTWTVGAYDGKGERW